jgi:hypothetical protein
MPGFELLTRVVTFCGRCCPELFVSNVRGGLPDALSAGVS